MALTSTLCFAMEISDINSDCYQETIVQDALKIFDEIKETLRHSLDRSDAPEEYPQAYQRFIEKEALIRQELSERPLEIKEIINRHLPTPGMSHLYFMKVSSREGSFALSPEKRTYYKKLDYNGEKIIYLRVADFADEYEPQLVHQAFEAAQETQFLLVDLRGNRGGRPEHLLSYLIREKSPILVEVGNPKPKGIWDDQKKDLNDLLGKFLDVPDFRSSSLNEIKNRSFESIEESKEYYRVVRKTTIYPLIWSIKAKTGAVLSGFDKLIEKKIGSSRLREFVQERKDSFKALVNETMIEDCGKSELDDLTAKEVERLKQEIKKVHQDQIKKYKSLCLENCDTKVEDLKKQVKSLEDSLKIIRKQLFEKHFEVLTKWYQETIEMLNPVWNQSLYEKLNYIPEDFLSKNFDWSKKVKNSPFGFTGKVAFLVNKQTFCAAELCALVPYEYQQLRDLGEIRGIKYTGELFAKEILIIGQTLGGAQGLGEDFLNSKHLGLFSLYYPLCDVYSYVNGHKVEGNGVEGIPVMRALTENHGLDSNIVQAIEWGLKK